jgi:hypothetical protein
VGSSHVPLSVPPISLVVSTKLPHPTTKKKKIWGLHQHPFLPLWDIDTQKGGNLPSLELKCYFTSAHSFTQKEYKGKDKTDKDPEKIAKKLAKKEQQEKDKQE